jgi:hypothetical protein
MADISQFFGDYLTKKIAGNPNLAKEINAVYLFAIEGAGDWTVDLTGAGSVEAGRTKEAGCTVTAKAADFQKLLDNPASAIMMFTMGKLKVSNVSLGMALQKLLS